MVYLCGFDIDLFMLPCCGQVLPNLWNVCAENVLIKLRFAVKETPSSFHVSSRLPEM